MLIILFCYIFQSQWRICACDDYQSYFTSPSRQAFPRRSCLLETSYQFCMMTFLVVPPHTCSLPKVVYAIIVAARKSRVVESRVVTYHTSPQSKRKKRCVLMPRRQRRQRQPSAIANDSGGVMLACRKLLRAVVTRKALSAALVALVVGTPSALSYSRAWR